MEAAPGFEPGITDLQSAALVHLAMPPYWIWYDFPKYRIIYQSIIKSNVFRLVTFKRSLTRIYDRCKLTLYYIAKVTRMETIQ